MYISVSIDSYYARIVEYN